MITLTAGLLALALDEAGNVRLSTTKVFTEPTAGAPHSTPFVHILVGGALYKPASAFFSEGSVALDFGIARATISVNCRDDYVKLSVTSIDSVVDAWIWGPYHVALNGGYGEVIGVAWDGDTAIGLQSLNPKTIGGYPEELENLHPFREALRNDFETPVKASACAAVPIIGGAVLQAFARNRSRKTKRQVNGVNHALALPVPGVDAEISGSTIALFACPSNEILAAIESIELKEYLPHPVIDGGWGKTARTANASYLITDFSEATFAEALEYAKTAGLNCVYHCDPFRNWGHFELRDDFFPNGENGLKACAEMASRAGIHVGIHTLSNFTTTNDPYITPVPHRKLLKMGETTLRGDVDENAQSISINDSKFFEVLSPLNAARISDELIRYKSVDHTVNGTVLTGCERGAWGTVTAKHRTGTDVSRMWDHGYKVFFPDAELQREYCEKLGRLVAKTSIRRISFDGLEGCAYTGHEEFACSRFVKDCYDVWGPEVRSDASILSHYRWHIHTYMNWGEPWYADMRNAMFDYRKRNQAFFRRNFLPPMMGWFLLRKATRKYESTTQDDIEWMLSKAAGFGSGFALSASMDVLRSHGMTARYLALIRQWEAMRLSGKIPAALAEEMRDPKSEWHIEERTDGWLVHRTIITSFECSPEGAQPGMPAGADWVLFNPNQAQKMVFRMRAGDRRDRGAVINPSFRSGENYISFNAMIEAGQYLIYNGGREIDICDANFNSIRQVAGEGVPLRFDNGVGILQFKCMFEGEEPPYPMIKIFMVDEGEFIPFIS